MIRMETGFIGLSGGHSSPKERFSRQSNFFRKGVRVPRKIKKYLLVCYDF